MKPCPVQLEFRQLSSPDVAERSSRFFKTGKGEYAERDRFLGIRVPVIRAFARKHKGQPTTNVLRLLRSDYHEERLLALIMMVNRFERADYAGRSEIYEMYLENIEHVNNWDLVDSSAHQIVGGFLFEESRPKSSELESGELESSELKLSELSRSTNLWERRISIISTYHFIKKDQFDETFAVSRQLLNDEEDLIHKAVGWMLREVGNRCKEAEEKFLLEHYRSMPRTMLRYAIEKFPEVERKRYLRGDM